MSTQLSIVSHLPSPSNFESYARIANQIPMLKEEEERELVRAWQNEKNKEAAQNLILAHLKLVVRVVRNHKGYGLPQGDLAQEGTIGLMKAVHRFDLSMGVRLAAYALRWIEAEIREFIFKNFRMVRLSSSSDMKKLFFGYRQAIQKLQKMDGKMRTIPTREIAQALDISEENVERARSFFLGEDASLDIRVKGESEQENAPLLLEAISHEESTTPESQLMVYRGEEKVHEMIEKGLNTLNDREKDIIVKRHLIQPTAGLAELGSFWKISPERVRQIETSAFKKMKKQLQDEYEEA